MNQDGAASQIAKAGERLSKDHVADKAQFFRSGKKKKKRREATL